MLRLSIWTFLTTTGVAFMHLDVLRSMFVLSVASHANAFLQANQWKVTFIVVINPDFRCVTNKSHTYRMYHKAHTYPGIPVGTGRPIELRVPPHGVVEEALLRLVSIVDEFVPQGQSRVQSLKVVPDPTLRGRGAAAVRTEEGREAVAVGQAHVVLQNPMGL